MRKKYCVVGMTTNEYRRQQEHEDDYPDLEGWEKLGKCDSREEAQDMENRLKEKCDRERGWCHSNGGGADPDDPDAEWIVYRFYTNYPPPSFR